MAFWKLCSLLLVSILPKHNCLNTWNKTIGPHGEDIWLSTTKFIPIQSTSYGTIQIGHIMTIEFDFIFHGRSNNPRNFYPENLFRIGHDAKSNLGCFNGYKAESRYPSLWLTAGNTSSGLLDISTTSGTYCSKSYVLHQYGTINIGPSHHIKLTLLSTQLIVDIYGGNKPNYTETFGRMPTVPEHIGQIVPIYFMSNKFTGTDYNIGNGIFSNIVIISKMVTPTPTVMEIEPVFLPTLMSPTTENPTSFPIAFMPYPTTEKPSKSPTLKPIYTPTVNPTVNPTVLIKNVPTYSVIVKVRNVDTHSGQEANALNAWKIMLMTIAILTVFWTLIIFFCIMKMRENKMGMELCEMEICD